ncbi:unnamed protein product [Phytomonas sp. EM1]|nr:unnamed protein product [Phytomonas sp. EM1]|eukprot:CCW60851.1 unnamed protein product [Phytomonas sp. isolate EM1]
MENIPPPPKGPSQIQYNFITVDEALKEFDTILSPYEQEEITSYSRIYYAGQRCRDKIQAPQQGHNYGYDNADSEYKIVVHDHIVYRYEIVGFLGGGTFAQVVKAIDHATKTQVAIKIAKNLKAITKQAEIEAAMLLYIQDADPNDMFGFMRMLNNFMFRNHMCIVSELLGMDLYTYMEMTDFKSMSLQEIKNIASTILISLDFMWRKNIIHRDLKPENIVFRSNDSREVKIIDMGSACHNDKKCYGYIQSRFYRAPEVILRVQSGPPIDMWSFGCILCELATGYPIFPGENENDQFKIIVDYIGPPPLTMLRASVNEAINSDATLCYLASQGENAKIQGLSVNRLASFLDVPPDDVFLNFIQQLLVWEPERRATPCEAMRHPWISKSLIVRNPTQGIDDIPTRTLTPNLEESVGAMPTTLHSQKTRNGEREDSWIPLETQPGATTESTSKEAAMEGKSAAEIFSMLLSSPFSNSKLNFHYTMLSCSEPGAAEQNKLSCLLQKANVRRTCRRPVDAIHAIIAQNDFTRNKSEIVKNRCEQGESVTDTHGP